MCKRTLAAGFTRSYELYPSAEAVMDINGSYTYEELEKRSNRLAHKLVEMGLAGCRVAVIMPRTREFVTAVLAANKAGAAYVPIEPDYAAGRVANIYEDAGFKAILTDRGALQPSVRTVCSQIPDDHILYVSEIAENGGNTEHIDNSDVEGECVLLYTSGSTGKPKGVIHSGHFFDLDPIIDKAGYKDQKMNFASLARFTFLASIFMGMPLFTGGAFYVLNEDESINMGAMNDIIQAHSIDGAFMPPKLAYSFFSMYPDSGLKFLFMAGEAMLQVPDTEAALYNLYGATEAGAVLINTVHRGEKSGLLGVPVYDDAIIYLLDEKGSVITENNKKGELCISSRAMSLGYSNLPELNHEK